MADLRFKSKRVKDEKAYKLRQVELKRYLDSFPRDIRDEAQLTMSAIYVIEKKINNLGYVSFFLMAIAIGSYALGMWQYAAGKAVSMASGIMFALLLLYIVTLAYKSHNLKLHLGRMRLEGIVQKNAD